MKNRKIILGLSTMALALSMPLNALSADIVINDEAISGKTIEQDGFVLVPAREVAESLGYSVEWDANAKAVSLLKGPAQIQFVIGVDGYSFARTAHMPLGKAPVIIDSKTYIPVEAFNLNDGYDITITESTVAIKEKVFEEEIDDSQLVTEDISTAEVISVENGQILVNDSIKGEVLLNLGSTPVLDSEGNEVEVTEGDTVTVSYGPAMTMSIPPINNPVSIVINEKVFEEEIDDSQLVTEDISTAEVISVEDGQILVNDSIKGEVLLNLGSTPVLDSEGNEVEVTEGDTVTVSYGPAMTMSIPPINNPVSITLE